MLYGMIKMEEADYKLLKKQIPRYLIAGFSGLAVDFILYHSLMRIIFVSPAKAVSFICGTTVSFLINTYWTYEKKDRVLFHAVKFFIFYGATLFVNVGTNRFVLLAFPTQYLLAFAVAAAVTIVLNFIGQKFWIFK